ncbi:MAG: hypothetical protein AB7P04_08580 [Bacteriovoracia bacterium]
MSLKNHKLIRLALVLGVAVASVGCGAGLGPRKQKEAQKPSDGQLAPQASWQRIANLTDALTTASLSVNGKVVTLTYSYVDVDGKGDKTEPTVSSGTLTGELNAENKASLMEKAPEVTVAPVVGPVAAIAPNDEPKTSPAPTEEPKAEEPKKAEEPAPAPAEEKGVIAKAEVICKDAACLSAEVTLDRVMGKVVTGKSVLRFTTVKNTKYLVSSQTPKNVGKLDKLSADIVADIKDKDIVTSSFSLTEIDGGVSSFTGTLSLAKGGQACKCEGSKASCCGGEAAAKCGCAALNGQGCGCAHDAQEIINFSGNVGKDQSVEVVRTLTKLVDPQVTEAKWIGDVTISEKKNRLAISFKDESLSINGIVIGDDLYNQ